MFLINLIIPYTDPRLLKNELTDISVSPFTLVFERASLLSAAAVMNAVVLTTVLSAGNSGLYAATRMLYVLATEGKAPRFFARLSASGVPRRALIAVTAIAALCFLTSIYGKDTVYLWLINTSGMGGFLCWLGIAVCHWRFRRGLACHGFDTSILPYRAKFFPLGTALAFAICLTVTLGQNYEAFLKDPVDWRGILATYIGIFIFAGVLSGSPTGWCSAAALCPTLKCAFLKPKSSKKKRANAEDLTHYLGSGSRAGNTLIRPWAPCPLPCQYVSTIKIHDREFYFMTILTIARRKLLTTAFAAAAALTFGTTEAAVAEAPARIAALPAIDAALLYAAEADGLYAKEGLNVEIVPFKSALELTAAMRAGKIAGHYTNLMTTITQRVNGIDAKVIATTWHTSANNRAFGLAVSPKAADRITSLEVLKAQKGVTTAKSSGTITDRMLDVMIADAKVGPEVFKDVEVAQIPIRLQMLNVGRLETALFYEPLLTLIEQKGGRVVWDDRKLVKPLSMISVRAPYQTPHFVGAFRRALSEAAKRLDADPEKYRSLLVKKGLIPKGLEKTYRFPKFGGFETADGLPPLPSDADVKEAADWLLKKGLIKSAPDVKAVVCR